MKRLNLGCDRVTLENHLRRYCSEHGGVLLPTTIWGPSIYQPEGERATVRISLPVSQGLLELNIEISEISPDIRINVTPEIKRGKKDTLVRQWVEETIAFLDGNDALKAWPDEFYDMPIHRRDRLKEVRRLSLRGAKIKEISIKASVGERTVKSDRQKLKEWEMI